MEKNANKLSRMLMIAKLLVLELSWVLLILHLLNFWKRHTYVHMFPYVNNEFVFLRPPLVQWAFASWKWLHYSNWILGRKKLNLQMQQRLLAERTAGQSLWWGDWKLDHESTSMRRYILFWLICGLISLKVAQYRDSQSKPLRQPKPLQRLRNNRKMF